MQLNVHLTHQQVSEHLDALRQEAAQSRLVSSRPGILAWTMRLLTPRNWNRRSAPARNTVRHT